MRSDEPRSHAEAPDRERPLRDSEAWLRQIVDNTTAAIFAKDREGRYLIANREFERLTGRRSQDIIGRTDCEIFPADLAARLRHNDLRVLLECRAMEFEETLEICGSPRTYLSSKFPLLDAHGAACGVCGVATDITDRKRLEDALGSAALAVSSSEGESLFAELARYLATILAVECACIAMLREPQCEDLHMLALYVNGVLHEHFDYPLAGSACETVIGHGFRIYPSRLSQLFRLEREFRDLGAESYAGFPLNDSAGRPLGVIFVASRRPMENPAFIESVLKIFAVRASAELQRMKADAALRASEASYREIFEASDDAIFVHDWDTGAILDVNPKACSAYGYTCEEMRALTVDDFSSGVPPYTGADALRLIEQAKREGSVRFEWHRRNKDGSLHWDEVYLRSARIGGQPRVLAFTREITERKLAEERRARLEAQLRQAQKMGAIGRLTGGIAHDFNNLLTSIMGYIVLATERQESLGDARLASYLEQAHISCERARNLIQQMLMFSRGQRGAPRPLVMQPLLEQSLGLLRPMLPATIDVQVELDPRAAAVMLDPVQLEQVLLNLCLNARDALNGAGRIRIGLRTTGICDGMCAACRQPVSGELVELSVEDDGPGMTEAVLERIFEPFFSTKESGKGTGMGLAMVHGIVHEHGGHVLVETAPGEGAKFRVLFPPLADAQALESARPAAAGRKPGGAPSLGGSVLIVDDEVTVGEFMRELLETWGVHATFMSRPQEALDAIRQAPARFDLVITDQAMPRMTGLDLARALRDLRADLPVILYTGFGENLTAADLRAAGIRALLPKPVEPQKLAAALIEHLPAQDPKD